MRPLSPDEEHIIAGSKPTLIDLCKKDDRWKEIASEMGAVAHGYYDAVEHAMEVAVRVAEDIIHYEGPA